MLCNYQINCIKSILLIITQNHYVYIDKIYIPVLCVIKATLKPPKNMSKIYIRIYRELFISKVDNWVGKTLDFDYLYHD